MDVEQARALRAPFPDAAVGKLPKPYRADSPRSQCNICGGYHGMPAAHLDYVGHAATTDRLLGVDPGWTWEPLAVDERGLPALDGRGNLWIRLTVAGVTRIGVGDGKSAKECIGDAIRNAAMRFGVALDLWAKEDLQSMASERGSAPAAAAPPPPAPSRAQPEREPEPAAEDAEPLLTPSQLRALQALFVQLGIRGPDARHAYLTRWLGRPIESTNELTVTEASATIDRLQFQVNTDD